MDSSSVYHMLNNFLKVVNIMLFAIYIIMHMGATTFNVGMTKVQRHSNITSWESATASIVNLVGPT